MHFIQFVCGLNEMELMRKGKNDDIVDKKKMTAI